MAFTVDNAPASRGIATSATSLTFSGTRTAGNGVLIVGVGTTQITGTPTVTYDGQSVPFIDGAVNGGATWYGLFRLVNPTSSGTKNIVVTVSGATAVIIANYIDFHGDPDTGAANSNKQQASSVTTLNNALSVGDQSWIAIVGGSNAVDCTGGTNVTNNSTANPLCGWFGPRSGAGSTTLTINTSGSDTIISVTCEIKPNAVTGGWGPLLNTGRNRLVA